VNPTYAAALDYTERGWQVLPCHTANPAGCSCPMRNDCSSPGKHPRTNRGVHQASVDPTQLRRWFSSDANLGIRTGAASGLVVIDIDPRHGGDATWQHLLDRHGDLSTYTVRTGSGGTHHYLQHPGRSVRNSAGMLGPGIDIRGDNGYVIAPPSRHTRGHYQLVDDQQPAACPQWLLGALRPPPVTVRRHQIERGSPSSATVERWLNELRSAPEGTRNHTLNRVAYILGRATRGAEGDVQARLVSEAVAIGLPELEARRTTASGFEAGVRQRDGQGAEL